MRQLFTFNREYVSAVAGGLSDDDTQSLLQEAFEALGDEIQYRVSQVDKNLVVQWDEDGPYIELNEQQFNDEFGSVDDPAHPQCRPAFIQAVSAAERAFTETLS